jgi:hypothetical protein
MGTFTTSAVLANNPGPQTLGLTDASQFLVGDKARIDLGVAGDEIVQILTISANNITAIFQNAHASGVSFALHKPCTSIYVQTLDGNTGAIYIGTSKNMVRATGVGVIVKLQPVSSGVQPVDFNTANNYGANAYSPDIFFVDGDNTGDKYLPSIAET